MPLYSAVCLSRLGGIAPFQEPRVPHSMASHTPVAPWTDIIAIIWGVARFAALHRVSAESLTTIPWSQSGGGSPSPPVPALHRARAGALPAPR